MSSDGSDVRLVIGEEAMEVSADWSPDGEWIAYTRLATPTDVDVYMIRPDGSDNTNVTRHQAYDAWPNWRPLN